MSSKSSVIYTDDAHIYEETNRQQSIFGKFHGFDLICDISAASVKYIKFEGQYFEATFKSNSPISKELGDTIKLWGGDVILVEMDEEYLSVEIKGGSQTARKFLSKEFQPK